MSTVPSSRALTALVTGAATTAYYALPDVVPSRTARGWLKAACAGVAIAASAPGGRDAWTEMRTSWRDDAAGYQEVDGTAAIYPDATGIAAISTAATDDNGVPSDTAASPARGTVLAVAGVAVVVGTIVATVLGERWVFRRGEARAAAGVRFAHTRTAVVLGALNAAATFLPESPSRR